MSADYVSVTIELPESQSELVQLALHEAGALGLEVRDAEAPPMPGVVAPSPGCALVIGFFDDAAAAQRVRAQVAEELPGARVLLTEVPNQDWSHAWRSLIRSVEVGRLWVGPPWLAPGAPAGKVKVVIEPKMAFGTGDHPTTSLCLEAVDALLPGRPKASVLDVGTGTGVLAIAAKKLGAGRVVGVDNDPMSVELARENAQVNGVEGLELSGDTLDEIAGTFDLVLANILANTLIDLAPKLAPKVGGVLVLAGVLEGQRREVEQAYLRLGLKIAGGKQQGEWVRIDLART